MTEQLLTIIKHLLINTQRVQIQKNINYQPGVHFHWKLKNYNLLLTNLDFNVDKNLTSILDLKKENFDIWFNIFDDVKNYGNFNLDNLENFIKSFNLEQEFETKLEEEILKML